jgi:hypothetical protein
MNISPYPVNFELPDMGLGTDSELVWLDSATNIAILAAKGECKIAWRAAD